MCQSVGMPHEVSLKPSAGTRQLARQGTHVSAMLMTQGVAPSEGSAGGTPASCVEDRFMPSQQVNDLGNEGQTNESSDRLDSAGHQSLLKSFPGKPGKPACRSSQKSVGDVAFSIARRGSTPCAVPKRLYALYTLLL